MSCCGQKRQAWRDWNPRSAPASKPATPVLQNPTLLQYVGSSSLVIKGAITGHTYLFAALGTELAVDGRDAPALLATTWLVHRRPAEADSLD